MQKNENKKTKTKKKTKQTNKKAHTEEMANFYVPIVSQDK